MTDSEVVVDAFLNPVLWTWDDAPSYVHDAVAGVFKGGEELLRPRSIDEIVAEMDAAGVTHGVLNWVHGTGPYERVSDLVRAHPDRFVFSAEVDPRQGMDAVRAVEELVHDHDARLVRIMPSLIGLPPTDAAYYPIFAKCVELGVPIGLNTGIPGPRLPADPQRPLYLDEVCRFFPELTVVMQHGADPWWGEAIRLLGKYPNLYLLTSAWVPKYLPDEFVHGMQRRFPGKVLFGTDYPMLSLDRCATEARALPLDGQARVDYLGGVARKLFWKEPQ